jgi:secreted trypsin-like serine protease
MFRLLISLLLVIRLTNSQECGKSQFGASFSVGGEYSEPGQWPWLAPLFKRPKDKAQESFFCGSTIIAKRFLLSGESFTQKLSKNLFKI